MHVMFFVSSLEITINLSHCCGRTGLDGPGAWTAPVTRGGQEVLFKLLEADATMTITITK